MPWHGFGNSPKSLLPFPRKDGASDMAVHGNHPPVSDRRAEGSACEENVEDHHDQAVDKAPREEPAVARKSPKTSDRIFLRLNDGWALGYNPLQWMLMRARKRREQTYWQPVAFIATEKRILRRVLREKGVEPTPEAAEYIDAMPDTFREWYAQRESADAQPGSRSGSRNG